MDINKLIDVIIRDFYLEFGVCNISHGFRSYLEELGKSVDEEKKVGIYGTGEHTKKLLEYISGSNISLFINTAVERREFLGRAVVVPGDVRIQKLDMIIISSYVYRDEMKEKLFQCGIEKEKVIDIYDFFKSCPLPASIENFYNMAPDYCDIFRYRELLQKEERDLKKRASCLLYLVDYSLEIRDIKSALEYMAEYIENCFDGYERLGVYYREIEGLLSKIKNKIQARKVKDIIVNWVDALGSDLSNMPFLIRESKGGISFENAFTVIPFTTPVKEVLHYGVENLDGKLFRHVDFKGETPLLKMCEENDYQLIYIAEARFCSKWSEENSRPVVNGNNDTYIPSPLIQWEMLNILTDFSNTKPLLLVAHNLFEVHEPSNSPYFAVTLPMIENEYLKEEHGYERLMKDKGASEKYLDEQLAWNHRFLPRQSICIYFSDHGYSCYRKNYNYFSDPRVKIFFFITSSELLPIQYDRMFSIKYFKDVIKKLMKNQIDFSSILKDYVLIQGYDAYSEDAVNSAIRGGRLNWTRNNVLQYRGIRTMVDKYIHYVDGREYYFILPDEQNNLIDEEKYAERIAKLRKLAGDDFIDVFKEEKFINSRRLYQYYHINGY